MPRPPKEPPIESAFHVGKSLVSPLPRSLGNGLFSAGVSIRTGSGSMTRDRVFRFVPTFDTAEQASGYALRQAMAWLQAPACPAAGEPHNPQE